MLNRITNEMNAISDFLVNIFFFEIIKLILFLLRISWLYSLFIIKSFFLNNLKRKIFFLFIFKESKQVKMSNDVDGIRSLFVQVNNSIKLTFSVSLTFYFKLKFYF
jgi:hypothetical protein